MRKWIDLMETQNQMGDYYHASPAQNIEPILQNGLIPTRNNQWGAEHQDSRIYLTQTSRDSYIVTMQMMARNPQIDKMAVFRIRANISVTDDPDWDVTETGLPAVFTHEVISPESIVGYITYDRDDYHAYCDEEW